MLSSPPGIIAISIVVVAGLLYLALLNTPEDAADVCEGSKGQHSGTTFVSFKDSAGDPSKALRIHPLERDIVVDADSVKGSVDWEYIRAVRYHIETAETGLLEIEYESPSYSPFVDSSEDIRFGIVSRDCWEIVVAAFGEQVLAEVVE